MMLVLLRLSQLEVVILDDNTVVTQDKLLSNKLYVIRVITITVRVVIDITRGFDPITYSTELVVIK